MPSLTTPTTTAPSSPSAAADDLLPPYFPLKLRKCIDVADTFFACFEKESFPNGDPNVAREAVRKCAVPLDAYKACMEKFVGPRAERR
ncbi:uncharacterized protein EV422DRAFT_571524 [Fimicolochytrium jonesii]|uniref:uncharacterized protein n=1 Tax=Fimicolochytrium jonesii TaxID=1396493 RepID=UPI0022FE19E6|nr:uncharacterized protein EV422DRAFT_571524 [Fimicolochytrium jonesii]KAI8816771.1 hypothetical protein EV422DRAFT_571524 [Fimicolochytrium jonesii]